MAEYIEIIQEERNDGLTIAKASVEETPIRNIDVPREGQAYQKSYYHLLEHADKNTIHFADSVSELPTYDEYDTLIGVAPSDADHIDGQTLHIYDSESGEWTDTFNPLSEFITEAEDEIDDFWEYVDLEVYDSAGKLEEQVLKNKKDISELDDRVDEEVDDVEATIRNATGGRYVDESITVAEELDELEAKVDDLYDAIR